MMPKFSIDLFVKAQVMEAYCLLDDPNHQQKEINGSVIRRTRIIIENIITWRKETDYWELQIYYQMREQWAEEVNEVHGNIQKKWLTSSLHQLVPKWDAIVAERIYRLFRPNYGALWQLTRVSRYQIVTMMMQAFEELEHKITEIQQGILVLEEFDFEA